jgi:hypothetical protein
MLEVRNGSRKPWDGWQCGDTPFFLGYVWAFLGGNNLDFLLSFESRAYGSIGGRIGFVGGGHMTVYILLVEGFVAKGTCISFAS